MPSEIMDQRRFSLFSEELLFPTERQVGFWKMESVVDHRGGGAALMSGSQSVSSSSLLGKLQPVGPISMESLELSQPDRFKAQKIKFDMENQLVGARNGTSSLSVTSWRGSDHDSGIKSRLSMQSFSTEGNKVDMVGLPNENGLFSCSLSELLDRKLKLSSNIASLDQSIGTINYNFEEEEPLESLEEIEAQTIGNLLPDDDDLLLGEDIGYIPQPNSGDDIDDDIFCTGGGIELGGDENSLNASDLTNADGLNDLQGGLNSQFAGEHQYVEQPSRNLFVWNINSNIEDSELKVFFEQYGDIRTLYTACKHRGFVMISYYDIRAAKKALRSLQSKQLRSQKLGIHYSTPKVNPSEKDISQGKIVVFNLDSSVSNDVLHQIFGVYGEIKEICETPHKQHHKSIEFYDVRAAEAALHALNGTDIAGQKIYLEPSCHSSARWCLSEQISPELEQEASSVYKQGRSPSGSLPGTFGLLPLAGITSSIDKLSSPVNVSSVDNPCGHGENGSFLEQMKFGIQSMPVMHPHSLHECHDRFTNGITYNSSNNMSATAMNFSPRPGEGIDNRYIQGVGSGSLTSPSFESAFGTPGNGSCPVHGHQYIWKNAKAYLHRSSGPMIWGNSPPFINNVPSHHTPQLYGFPGARSHMLNAVPPIHHPHHVGSAPTVNPSIWERRHPYIGDPTDIHPGSLGNMGFYGTSPLGLAAHNIIDHVGIPSPQQRCHIQGGRNHVIPVHVPPFDVANDRIRSRRSDSNANPVDNKKQYELDVERIIRGEDSRTTLMIKNIPNKYTSKMLLAAIDEHHKGTYDFIYLPIDFKNKCNVGYAFINMIDPQQIIPLFQAFNGKKWEKFNSEKVASLAYARIQGKAALIAHFQNSSLMNEDKRCRPILFHSDGPNAGDQEPFPAGSNIRSRPGRSKSYPDEENDHVSPSTSPNGMGFSNTADITNSVKDSE